MYWGTGQGSDRCAPPSIVAPAPAQSCDVIRILRDLPAVPICGAYSVEIPLIDLSLIPVILPGCVDVEACLDGDCGTIRVEGTGVYTGILLHIKVPTNVMTNMIANTLVLRPLPVLCHDLVSFDMIPTSGNVCSLSGGDLAHLPGYSTGDEIVHAIGDIRLFLPPTAARSLRIHLQAGGFPYRGFSEVLLKTATLALTASLSLDLSAVAGSTVKWCLT